MQVVTNRLVRILRCIRLLLHVVSGVIQSLVYPYFPQKTQHRLMQRWSAGLLRSLNIQLHCDGKLPTVKDRRVMFAANHISWLDVIILMAACPTRFVAKAEISGWPVLGFLSRNAGTLFIERTKRRDTRRINKDISDVLSTGDRVTVFPEGTTCDGTILQHFHASLLQSALTPGTRLYPVAICYRNVAGEISREAPYTEASLAVSLKKILSQTRIDATLTFIEPIDSYDKNRRELARLSEQAIANTLSITVAHRELGKFSDPPTE